MGGMGRYARGQALFYCAGCSLLTACATTPPTPEGLANNDPYEPTNRQTLLLNGKIDRYIVVPTVAVYFVLVPDGRPARRA